MTHPPATINLFLNGTTTSLPQGITVQAMLAAQGINPQNVAVERNGAIVPKSAFATMTLDNGDQVEIIGFIGGG
jgi:thiamine biosynthesis protein ThiS